MNRRTILALIAAIAVIATSVGWFAGQRIKSPAEIAAETEAPEASLITAPVEERDLSTSVVLRGQVEFDDVAEIPVNPSAEGSTIITNVPLAVGADLVNGVADPSFVNQTWPETETWLRSLNLTKYCDLNLTNLVQRPAIKDTVEIRLLPGALDASSILGSLDRLRETLTS